MVVCRRRTTMPRSALRRLRAGRARALAGLAVHAAERTRAENLCKADVGHIQVAEDVVRQREVLRIQLAGLRHHQPEAALFAIVAVPPPASFNRTDELAPMLRPVPPLKETSTSLLEMASTTPS